MLDFVAIVSFGWLEFMTLIGLMRVTEYLAEGWFYRHRPKGEWVLKPVKWEWVWKEDASSYKC